MAVAEEIAPGVCVVCGKPTKPMTDGYSKFRITCSRRCLLVQKSRSSAVNQRRSRNTTRDRELKRLVARDRKEHGELAHVDWAPSDCPRARHDDGPCIHVACRHHLLGEVTGDGAIILDPRAKDLDSAGPTCALRLVETGKDHTLEEIGELFGVTRERIRQIEARALRRLALQCKLRGLKLEDIIGAEPSSPTVGAGWAMVPVAIAGVDAIRDGEVRHVKERHEQDARAPRTASLPPSLAPYAAEIGSHPRRGRRAAEQTTTRLEVVESNKESVKMDSESGFGVSALGTFKYGETPAPGVIEQPDESTRMDEQARVRAIHEANEERRSAQAEVIERVASRAKGEVVGLVKIDQTITAEPSNERRPSLDERIASLKSIRAHIKELERQERQLVNLILSTPGIDDLINLLNQRRQATRDAWVGIGAMFGAAPPEPARTANPPPPHRPATAIPDDRSPVEHIVEQLEVAREPLSSREVSKRSGVHISKIAPALSKMKEKGLVIHDPEAATWRLP